MRKPLAFLITMAGLTAALQAQSDTAARRNALLARAKALELSTAYVPPPGDPLEHHTAGYAKIMCSAVFITGLDPDFAAKNVGYFTSPYAEREGGAARHRSYPQSCAHNAPKRRDAHR